MAYSSSRNDDVFVLFCFFSQSMKGILTNTKTGNPVYVHLVKLLPFEFSAVTEDY